MKYTNMSGKEEQEIRSLMILTSECVRRAYSANIREDDRSEFKTWFGSGDKTFVRNILHKINYGLINGTLEVIFDRGDNTLDGEPLYASALPPIYGWSIATIVQACSEKSNFVLTIYPSAFREISLLCPGDKSQVSVIAHELSHLLGGTEDIDFPTTNSPAQGFYMTGKLARHYPALAINNAENYGFYIASFARPR